MKALLACALLVCACDGGSPTTNNKSGNGAIKITSPTNNASVTATAANPDVDVAFTVTGFTLKAPGTCAGSANCGHVHLVVDGTTCNDPAAPGPYNNDGFASPISIGLDYCPAISGAHSVVAELHNDDHSNYTNPAGTLVTDTIAITVP